MYHKRLSLLGIMFLTISSGCFNSHKKQPASFNLPDSSTVEITELFRISEPVEGSFFRFIKKIHVLSNGNLVVQNYPDTKLYQIDQSGNTIQTIGRKGRGPGEFMETFFSFLVDNDSLHVIDFNHARHQILKKNKHNEWKWERERFYLNPKESEMRELTPSTIFKRRGRYIGKFLIAPGNSAIDTLAKNYHYLANLDHNLDHQGKVNRLRPTGDTAILRTKNSSTQTTNPLFWEAFYLYNSKENEVIYINNNSNKIIGIDSLENERIKGYLPFEHFSSNSKEIENRINSSKKFTSQMGRNASTMEQIIRSKLLAHEPFYYNIILHENRLWIHLARSDSSKPNWIITDLKGDIIEAFHGPTNISQIVIHENKIFGRQEDSDGTIYLTGYKMNFND